MDDKALRDIAKEYFSRTQRLAVEYTDGKWDAEGMRMMLQGEKELISTILEPSEIEFVMSEYAKLNDRARDVRKSPADMIADRVMQGKPTHAYMIERLAEMGLPPEEIKAVEQMWEEQVETAPDLLDMYNETIDMELGAIEDVDK